MPIEIYLIIAGIWLLGLFEMYLLIVMFTIFKSTHSGLIFGIQINSNTIRIKKALSAVLSAILALPTIGAVTGLIVGIIPAIFSFLLGFIGVDLLSIGHSFSIIIGFVAYLTVIIFGIKSGSKRSLRIFKKYTYPILEKNISTLPEVQSICTKAASIDRKSVV